MGRACGVCIAADREAIDKEILSGQPLTAISTRRGLHRQALARHLRKHLARTLKRAEQLRREKKREIREEGREARQAVEVAAILDAEDRYGDELLDQLQGLGADAKRLLDKAEAAQDFKAAVAAVREARATIETIARLTGRIKSGGGEVNVFQVDEATLQRIAAAYLDEARQLPPAIDTTKVGAEESGDVIAHPAEEPEGES